jgi:hypothetical protein
MPAPRTENRLPRIYLPRAPVEPRLEMMRRRTMVERSTIERKVGALEMRDVPAAQPYRYWRSWYMGVRVYLITHAEKHNYLRVYGERI